MENSIPVTDPAKISLLIRKTENAESVFSDPAELIHHIIIFRTNPNYEWFNAMLIALDSRLRESGFTMVRPENYWDSNVNQFGLKGEGIDILWPYINSETKEFSWIPKTVYSIFDFGLSEPAHEKDIETPLSLAVKTYDLAEIMFSQKAGWQDELLMQYLSGSSDYRQSDGETQRFYKSALIMAWGSMLNINRKLKKTDLILSNLSGNPKEVYESLFKIITGFIPFIIEWMMLHSEDHRDVRSLTLQCLYGAEK